MMTAAQAHAASDLLLNLLTSVIGEWQERAVDGEHNTQAAEYAEALDAAVDALDTMARLAEYAAAHPFPSAIQDVIDADEIVTVH